MKWIVLGVILLLSGLLLKNTTELFVGQDVSSTNLNATVTLAQAYTDALSFISTVDTDAKVAALKANAFGEYDKQMIDSSIKYLQNFLSIVNKPPTSTTVQTLQTTGMNVVLVSQTVSQYVATLKKLTTTTTDMTTKLKNLYTDAARAYKLCKNILAATPSISTTESTMKAILSSLEDPLVTNSTDFMAKISAYDNSTTPDQYALEQNVYELSQKVGVLFYLIKTSPGMFPRTNQLGSVIAANRVPVLPPQ